MRGESGVTFHNEYKLPLSESNVQIPRLINDYFPAPNPKHLSDIQIIPPKIAIETCVNITVP
jgi:hypothetical protein